MKAHPIFDDPRPRILPSILSADLARLGDDLANALALGGDFPHIDVMDGHLVPNLSIGVPVVEKLRKTCDRFFDVHLMIEEPVRYAPAFVRAGADNLTIHIEAEEVRPDPRRAIQNIRQLGCSVGLTLKPGTPVEEILPFVEQVNVVLVMSVEPGFGGQAFMPEMLEKVRRLRPILRPGQVLEIDGGIGPETIRAAREAGVDWFVVGSALFDAADRESAIRTMRREIATADGPR
jgi:ribulose-phosphate 3-epimerase